MNQCQVCNTETKNDFYCSHKCRASITSFSLKGRNHCPNCQAMIRWNRTYCSSECRQSMINQKADQLAASGQASDSFMKKYLIKKHGNLCMDPMCAWDFNKRPVSIELDHIDGKASNNHLSNLRLLCPNCHSLTSTYKVKNRGNGTRANRRVGTP